jgi:hypothetical protein
MIELQDVKPMTRTNDAKRHKFSKLLPALACDRLEQQQQSSPLPVPLDN